MPLEKKRDPRTWAKMPDGNPLLPAIPKTNLKKLLKEREITQKDLAEKMGVSRDTVSAWLNGREHMSDERVTEAAILLDTSPLVILDLSDSRADNLEEEARLIEAADSNRAKMLEILQNLSDFKREDGTATYSDQIARLEDDAKSMKGDLRSIKEFCVTASVVRIRDGLEKQPIRTRILMLEGLAFVNSVLQK